MASLPVVPGHGGFVQPSSYLRPRRQSQPMTSPKPESAVERDQRIGLVSFSDNLFSWHVRSQTESILTSGLLLQQRIRDFLKARTSYDVLPLSFRLIVFDTSLLVKKSLTILTQNGELVVLLPGKRQSLSTFRRHRLSAFVGFQDLDLCRLADQLRLH